MMDITTIHPQQNLYDLGAGQKEPNLSRSGSFGFGIFVQTKTIRDAASTIASKIRKVVKPTDRTSEKSLIEIQELTVFITKTPEIWKDFRSKLVKANITTHMPVPYILLEYISERRGYLEVMHAEYKKKHKEGSTTPSSGVRFIRRMRDSTETIANMASTGIRNMQRRTSIELARRNRDLEGEKMHNITQALQVSTNVRRASCQMIAELPKEHAGKAGVRHSVPAPACSGSLSTIRMSFNFLRRGSGNSNKTNAKDLMIRRRVSPSKESVSGPKRYAELPRKLGSDIDASVIKPRANVTPAKLQSYDFREENRCIDRGNEEWDTKPPASESLDSRLNAGSNFSLSWPDKERRQVPKTLSKEEDYVDVKSHDCFVGTSTVNRKGVSGETSQSVFDLKDDMKLSKPFDLQSRTHIKGPAPLTNTPYYHNVAKMKSLRDTATLQSKFNDSMESL